MMTIDNEVQVLIHFLSHQADYTVTIDHLTIGSVCHQDDCWVVCWKEQDGNTSLDCQKDFYCLFDACQYFVEKRRYFCIGSDFRELMEENNGGIATHVEITDETKGKSK